MGKDYINIDEISMKLKRLLRILFVIIISIAFSDAIAYPSSAESSVSAQATASAKKKYSKKQYKYLHLLKMLNQVFPLSFRILIMICPYPKKRRTTYPLPQP